jgi:hypothetical protein
VKVWDELADGRLENGVDCDSAWNLFDSGSKIVKVLVDLTTSRYKLKMIVPVRILITVAV